MVFNPKNWLTVEEVLEHKYLKEFHKKEEEITCKEKIILNINDNDKLSLKNYRDAIYLNISDNIKEHTRKTK